MNAVDMLVKHHRRLEELLGELMKADEEKRGPLFDEAADFLLMHVTIEEKHFYPAVKAGRTEDVLLESLEEHLSLKRVVADMLALRPSEDTFEPKLHVLKEQAEHHHKEEEENLFPKVRKRFDDASLRKLGVEMEATMTELLRGEPRRLALGQTDAATPLA